MRYWLYGLLGLAACGGEELVEPTPNFVLQFRVLNDSRSATVELGNNETEYLTEELKLAFDRVSLQGAAGQDIIDSQFSVVLEENDVVSFPFVLPAGDFDGLSLQFGVADAQTALEADEPFLENRSIYHNGLLDDDRDGIADRECTISAPMPIELVFSQPISIVDGQTTTVTVVYDVQSIFANVNFAISQQVNNTLFVLEDNPDEDQSPILAENLPLSLSLVVE
jgi:hypothetical protein